MVVGESKPPPSAIINDPFTVLDQMRCGLAYRIRRVRSGQNDIHQYFVCYRDLRTKELQAKVRALADPPLASRLNAQMGKTAGQDDGN